MDTAGFTGGVSVEPEPRTIWTNASDHYSLLIHNDYGRAIQADTSSFDGNKVTLWRWRDDFQNDFAARMGWCTKSYADANHPPVPVLAHPEKITVKSGEMFCLDASSSTDPEGDNLSFIWFQYPEAGSYKKMVTINGASNLWRLFVTAPEVAKKETVHFILKLTDKGNPHLTRYERVLVTIVPR
jgi:hypothetical protein